MKNAENEKFSLIIPVHVETDSCLSESAESEQLLRGIIENSPGVEVIVVDNGSCAGWRGALRRLRARIVSHPERLSYSRACNLGAMNASADIFCFLNSDVIAESPDWSEPFLDALGDEDVGAAGAAGRRLLPGSWRGGEIRYDDDVDYLEGWCVWMTKSTFNLIGGWDERYSPYYCEDAELSLKIRYSYQKRIKIVPAGECRLKHIGGMTIKSQPEDERSHLARNSALLKSRWEHVFHPGAGFSEIKEDRIAVLVAARVKESYLTECLESVAECGNKNISVYVGLDCMDFSGRRRFEDVDLKFRFYDLTFGNASETRNYLFAESVEPYLLFLDGDDMIAPGAPDKMIARIKEGYDVIYGKGLICDESSVRWFFNQTDGYLNTRAFDSWRLRRGNFIPMPSLIRRGALPPGAPFDPKLPALHDWDLWLRMLSAGRKFSYVNEKCFIYRIHDSNLSRNGERWAESVKILREKHGDDIGDERNNICCDNSEKSGRDRS